MRKIRILRIVPKIWTLSIILAPWKIPPQNRKTVSYIPLTQKYRPQKLEARGWRRLPMARFS